MIERDRASAALGIYDVSITDDDNVPVAEFRGRSRTTSLPVPGRTRP